MIKRALQDDDMHGLRRTGGLTWSVRLSIPRDRWADAGKDFGTKSGIKQEVIRSLGTRAKHEALRRHDKALVAQQESEAIYSRTKAALAEAKARGKKLGGYRPGARKVDCRLSIEACQKAAEAFRASVGPMVADLRDEGLSLRQIPARARPLNYESSRVT